MSDAGRPAVSMRGVQIANTDPAGDPAISQEMPVKVAKQVHKDHQELSNRVDPRSIIGIN